MKKLAIALILALIGTATAAPGRSYAAVYETQSATGFYDGYEYQVTLEWQFDGNVAQYVTSSTYQTDTGNEYLVSSFVNTYGPTSQVHVHATWEICPNADFGGSDCVLKGNDVYGNADGTYYTNP